VATQPFNKFYCFVEDIAEKKHDLSADVLKVMLTNTLPVASTALTYTGSLPGGISSTELANGAGYTTGGATATISSSTQTSGVYKLVLADVSWTASGSMGPFRYAVLYNFTNTTANKPLIGYWDNGASVTLANTEVFTVDFDPSTGVIQLT
jgi:hypothetical protein